MIRQTLCAALVAALTILSSGHAGAETIAAPEDLKAGTPFAEFLKGKQHSQAKAAIARLEDRSVGRECADAYALGNYILKIITPIEMAKDAVVPSAGQWIERYPVTRCGRQSIFNALFAVNDKGILQVRAVAPGETGQSAQLVLDLRPVMIKNAKLGQCDKRGLLDTAKGVPEGYEAKVPDGIYETWTVSGCGKDVDMVLLFTPTENDQVNVQVEKQIPR